MRIVFSLWRVPKELQSTCTGCWELPHKWVPDRFRRIHSLFEFSAGTWMDPRARPRTKSNFSPCLPLDAALKSRFHRDQNRLETPTNGEDMAKWPKMTQKYPREQQRTSKEQNSTKSEMSHLKNQKRTWKNRPNFSQKPKTPSWSKEMFSLVSWYLGKNEKDRNTNPTAWQAAETVNLTRFDASAGSAMDQI